MSKEFTLSTLCPPIGDFVRSPVGTVTFYLVDEFVSMSQFSGYATRSGGKIKMQSYIALDISTYEPQKMIRCEVLETARPREKRGPKSANLDVIAEEAGMKALREAAAKAMTDSAILEM